MCDINMIYDMLVRQGKYMTWVSGTKGRAFESPIAHHRISRAEMSFSALFLWGEKGKKRGAKRRKGKGRKGKES